MGTTSSYTPFFLLGPILGRGKKRKPTKNDKITALIIIIILIIIGLLAVFLL